MEVQTRADVAPVASQPRRTTFSSRASGDPLGYLPKLDYAAKFSEGVRTGSEKQRKREIIR
jgi:hypothetical protein